MSVSTFPPRLALICDSREEGWFSMDLVGDMLFAELRKRRGSDLNAAQVLLSLHPRLSRLPVIGNHRMAWNGDRFLNRFFDYPKWLRRHSQDFDLFHIVDHSYAQLVFELPARRTIVTCHDLDAFQCLLEPEHERRPMWFRKMARRVLDGMTRAAHIICVSATVRDQLMKYGLVAQHGLSVVQNGVDPGCSPCPNVRADKEADFLLRAGPVNAVYLLNVGSTVPRKRIDVLLRVFAAVHKELPSARLVRVGGPFTENQQRLADELNISNLVIDLPLLERGVLAAVYRRATVLLQTSESEGFGLPVAEAMACGCPVIASDIRALREVGGDAAVFCPVGDVETWTEAVVRSVWEQQYQPDRRENGRVLGLAQASRFSWAEAAARTVDIYRQVLAA